MLMTRTAGSVSGALVTCPVVTKPEFFPGFLAIFDFFWVY